MAGTTILMITSEKRAGDPARGRAGVAADMVKTGEARRTPGGDPGGPRGAAPQWAGPQRHGGVLEGAPGLRILWPRSQDNVLLISLT